MERFVQVSPGMDTVIPIEAPKLSRAQAKIAVLESELNLISGLGNSVHLDDIVRLLAEHIDLRWGFNIFGLQVCEHNSGLLIFHKLLNTDSLDSTYSSLDNFTLSLDAQKSISSQTAIQKRFNYHELSKIDELDYDFDAKITARLGLNKMLFVPIVFNESCLGVARLSASDNRMNIEPDDVDEIIALFEKISGVVASKLQHNQIERDSQLQKRNLKLIHDISSITDLYRLTELLIQEVLTTDAFDAIMINTLDNDKRTFCCKNVYLPQRLAPMCSVIKGLNFKFEPDAYDNSWSKTHKPIWIESSQFGFCSPFIKERCHKWEVQHLVVIPIIVSGLTIGTVCIFNRDNKLSKSKIHEVSKKIDLFSASICNALRVERVNNKEEELLKVELAKKKFLKFVEKINHISEPKRIYQNIADEFIRWFSFNMVSIHMSEEGYLRTKNITLDDTVDAELIESLKHTHESVHLELKTGESVQVSAILNDSTTHIVDVEQIKDLPMADKDAYCMKYLRGLRTVLHVPIRIGSEPVGLISLWSFGDTVELTEDEINLIELITSFCGSTINNGFLFTTVEEQKGQIENQYQELSKTRDMLEVARDEAESSTKAKTEFLANMSHEIRTPMNAIINFAELALKTSPNTKQVDYLSKIKKSSGSLLDIINDILDLSKIEANKFDIEQHEFDVIEVINDVSDMFAERVKSKGLGFYINGCALIKNCFIGDALRIKQVLINIINNSLKFTNEGHIELGVINSQQGDDSILEFYVKDTGIGIHQDKLNQLFESFTQADSSISRQYGGTGLGLTISKQLCNLMGGDIWVESEAGRGSCFHFSFKLKPSKTQNIIDAAITDDLCGKNILLINNLPQQTGCFLGVLGRLGATTDYINSIEALNDYIKSMQTSSNGVDLILIDEEFYNHDSVDGIVKLVSLTGAKCLVLQSADNHDTYLYCDAIGTKPITDSALVSLVADIFTGNKKQLNTPKETNISSVERKYYALLCNNNVLLIDDNETNLQIGQELLELVGVNVTAVSSGLQAINAINKNDFDLVITDIQMPHMDGYKLTSIIRDSFTEIPIIALTAHAMQGYKEHCMAAGMNDYLSKPISQNSLYKCLSKWLKPKKSNLNTINNSQPANPSVSSVLHSKQFSHLDLVSDIDLYSALESIGGSRKLFIKVMRTITTQYKEAPQYIRKRLSENSIDSALNYIHSFKGLIGTVAANNLYNTCRQLEVALAEHKSKFRADIFVVVDKLEHEFELVMQDLAAIITYTILLSNTDPASNQIKVDMPIDSKNHLDTFKELLEENNYRSLEFIPLIRKHFEQCGNEHAIASIESSIECFNFGQARQIFYSHI